MACAAFISTVISTWTNVGRSVRLSHAITEETSALLGCMALPN
jgi:hypothetical protein